MRKQFLFLAITLCVISVHLLATDDLVINQAMAPLARKKTRGSLDDDGILCAYETNPER